MFTKWFKNSLKCMIPSALSYTKANIAFSTTFKDITGTTRYIIAPVYSEQMFQYTNTVNAIGVSVGTGNTAATDEDYCLESQITSNMSGTIAYTKGTDTGDVPWIKLNIVLQNSSASDVTIKEIGLKGGMHYATSAGGARSSQAVFLIDRTVLTTPVTVPAGGNAAILYTLKTKYTEASS